MKYQVYVTLVIIVAILLISVQGRSRKRKSEGRKPKSSNSTSFDLFIFTQHWPPTVCFGWKKESSNHTCAFPKDDEEWSIHGIWPTKLKTMGPNFCNKTLPFKVDELKPIEDQLKDKWIDVENGTIPYSFWEHEWNKHGTCSAAIDEVNTEYKYFKKGLDLFDKYDMKHVLAKASILPGKSYQMETILGGIQKILGVRGHVECTKNKTTREQYIFEIRMCFDKRFNLINCTGTSPSSTNCSHKKGILYPGTTPNAIQVLQV